MSLPVTDGDSSTHLVGVGIHVPQWVAVHGGPPVQATAQHAMLLQQHTKQLPESGTVQVMHRHLHQHPSSGPAALLLPHKLAAPALHNIGLCASPWLWLRDTGCLLRPCR